MNTFRYAMSALSLSLAACVTVPTEAPSDRPLTSEQLGLGADASGPVSNDWWQAYRDPQLDRIMRDVLASNPSLAEVLARVRIAQQRDVVAKSRLYPAVDLDVHETRERVSGRDVVPPPYSGHTNWLGNEGLNLSWDLDFWGRQSELLKQTHLDTEAKILDASSARLAIIGAVLRSYVELDRQYRLADVAERTAKQREQILSITRERVLAGLDTNVELLQAEGAVQDAEVQLSQAHFDQDLARHRIAELAGYGANAQFELTRPALDQEAALDLPKTLPADLLGRRPDVLAARARIDAATAGRSAARAAFYPDINLIAFAGTAAIGFNNLFNATSGTYGVGPAIHLPIFNAGRLKAEYRSAGAEIDASVANYDAAVLSAVREVSDQLSAVDALRDQLSKQRAGLEDAEAAYTLARKRYDAGISSYLTVLTTEAQLLVERRQHVDLVAAQAIAHISLQIAVGGDFDSKGRSADVAAK